MLTRIAVVLLVAAAVVVLLSARVTVPVLTLVGLLAWAVLASVAAVIARRRLREFTSWRTDRGR